MGSDLILIPSVFGGFVDCPLDCGRRRFSANSSTGFADGGQRSFCPFTRTAMSHLDHQETVRHHNEIHMPGLALAVA